MHRKTVVFVLFAASICGNGSAQAAMSCIEIGQFVEGVAQARDRRQTQSRLIQIMKEDTNFSASEQSTLTQYIGVVFQSPDMPPKALANAAIDTCYRPSTARPKAGK